MTGTDYKARVRAALDACQMRGPARLLTVRSSSGVVAQITRDVIALAREAGIRA